MDRLETGIKCKRSKGYKPEIKQVVTLATNSAGITVSWASCNCPLNSACIRQCLMLSGHKDREMQFAVVTQ